MIYVCGTIVNAVVSAFCYAIDPGVGSFPERFAITTFVSATTFAFLELRERALKARRPPA